MFILGMVSVFIGISLLAPDEPRGMFVVDTDVFVNSECEDNDGN